MQTAAESVNKKVHSLIDSLTRQKMFGEVTFYMQSGIIESCRICKRHTKKEIEAMAEETKVLTPVKKGNAPTGLA